ncbi:MAG: hypothetical protein HOJ16_00310 [Candidatus Peribacter sp.]|jgi:hypothetical protein|nr:hypothetical protein [Candidatus Peribacter sp.]
MMKKSRNKIYLLRVEIEEINKSVDTAKRAKKFAFARRLEMMKDKKEGLLTSWLSNA